MQKIKEIFKPDVQKEAEARKAAEAQKAAEDENQTKSSSDHADFAETSPRLEAQPRSTLGTGGGLTESSESKYGATPGHGISSHLDDPSASASEKEKPSDIGSGNQVPGHLFIPDDVLSTSSIKSGVVGSSRLTGLASEPAYQTTAMPDRSVDTTTSVGQTAIATGSHQTFTGSRLDPNFDENTQSYRELHGTSTTSAAAPAAASAGTYESSQSREITDNTNTTVGTKPIAGMESTENKSDGLTSLFHRENPNKLRKEPPGGYPVASAPAEPGPAVETPKTTTIQPSATGPTTTIPTVQPAHQTFVQPGHNHEQHIGVDGPIGRATEISGLHGTDARKTSTAGEVDRSLNPSNPAYKRPEDNEPTLVERNASLGDGRVIEPTTGLPMNVGKYGTGTGGTDGSTQISGFDKDANAERLVRADENRAADKELTWQKIRDSNTPL